MCVADIKDLGKVSYCKRIRRNQMWSHGGVHRVQERSILTPKLRGYSWIPMRKAEDSLWLK